MRSKSHGLNFRRYSALFAMTLAMTTSYAGQVFIDFETHANGVAYTGLGDTFPSTEYASLGVTITASPPYGPLIEVDLSNPLNIGTPIAGYYVNVGAFPGSPFLDLQFPGGIQGLSFDFFNSEGHPDVTVTGFDSGDQLSFSQNLPCTSSFLNQAGFVVGTGNAALNFPGVVFRVHLENLQPNNGLGIDNLRFETVPEPTFFSLSMIGAALVIFLCKGHPHTG